MRRRLASSSLVGAAPGGDALDDEEPLPGLHVAEATCFALQGGGDVTLGEASVEAQLLRAVLFDLGHALGERVARREVALKRLRVEKRDEQDDADGEPVQQEPAAWNPAARSSLLRAAGHLGRDFESERRRPA